MALPAANLVERLTEYFEAKMNEFDLKQSRVLTDGSRIANRQAAVKRSVFLYGFIVGAFLLGCTAGEFLTGCTARESTESKLKLRSVERHGHFYIGMSASEAKKHLHPEAELRDLSVAYKYGRKENDPVYVFALPSDQNIGIGLYFNADKRLVEIEVPVEE